MSKVAKNHKIEKLGITTTASVYKHTKKHWDEWIAILKKQDAENWTHQEIVKFLKTKYKLKPWWQQVVAGGFELHTGRRVVGQTLKGDFTLTATKSFKVDAKKLWRFLASVEGANVWLKPLSDFALQKDAEFEVSGGIFGKVRTIKAPLRARLSWQDSDWLKPSILQIWVVPQPKNKSILVFSHEGLANARLKESFRLHWKNSLSEVAAHFDALHRDSAQI